ncbi:MFS transporter [Sphingomonas sp. SUN039]|uniref:MFS transporter n=1 Tax=Sphingomonas sp. SUN039 TaxID=2937787 RepID=UPI002164E70B|nr:MFS transporter [Sphingomonas sp. SUN039]UVO53744.1 MFS transporter [Sphingomonas sp. SUN039]
MAASTPVTDDQGALAPLGIPIFRAIWLASLASNFGGLIQSVGASWMMTTLAPTPTFVALVSASTTLPIMLLSLFAGAIADNFDRRRVMLAAQAFMLLVSVGLSVCAWSGALTPWLLLIFTFLIGVGTAFNGPAWQASVGDMVPRAALPGAVALNSMGFNIARSVGPALGGVIVAVAGAATAFLLNAVSYLGLIFVLLRWSPPARTSALPPEPLGVAMGAGLRYVAMSPDILKVLVRAGMFGFGASAISALMPLVARNMLGGGALVFGLLSGAFGIGAVLGALNGARLRRLMTTEAMVCAAIIALAAGTLVTGLSHVTAVSFVAILVAGGGWVTALSTFNVTVQMASPRWVVGRALALYQMVAFGFMAIGSWVFGEIAAAYGIPVALMTASIVLLAGILVGRIVPLPRATDLNLDPLQRWIEPTVAVPIEPRSGPIVVTLEYRIATDDISGFLAHMNERRRIRLRDGARHWTLLRDLQISDLWVERYHVATWNDYVRHNERRTQADAANIDAIHTLQRAGVPIVAHRMIERQTGSLIHRPDFEEVEPLTDPIRSA